MLERCWQDLRMACRGLWRVKSFSVTAVLTFAVGIAGTTAMFAVVDGVLLRPLPVTHQEQLVVAWKQLPSSAFDHYPFGDDDIDAVGRTSRLLQSVAGVTSNGVGRMALTEQGDASYVRVALVTERFFDVLGAHAVRGRAFAGSDGARRSDRTLVVSHAFWLRHFGGAEDVIGRRVRINEQSFTVVGVMPPGLDYPRGADAWQTTTSVPIDGPFGDAARREVDLLARTRPGVTAAQVRAELAGLIHGNEVAAPPTEPRGLLPVVQSFEDVVLGDVRRAMAVLLGAVGLVLLVACANVANLLLMRGDARRSELALRAALGAGRSGLIRQVLCESAVLACAAGGIGVAVTALSLKSLTAIIPGGLPRIDSVDLRASAVLFAIVIAFAAAFLAGLVPAIISTRRDLVSDLRSGAPALAGTGSRTGRRILVIAQLTFAVVALASATVLARSLIRVLAVKPGVEIDRVVFIDLHVPQLKYTDRARRERFLDDVLSRLEANPSIGAVTPVNVPPFSGEGGWDLPRFAAEGQSAVVARANHALNLESIYPNYFETFGIELLRGRSFTDRDREGAPDVAIISEDIAARTWPGQDPIGKRLKMGGAESAGPWYTIVGVAAETRYRELTKPHPTLYLPAKQFQMTASMLAVRTSAPIEAISSFTRQAVREIDPDVHVLSVVPFRGLFERPLARPKFTALLVGVFGVTALLLAAIGIYALMAASVRQRRREIGIRIALGATPAVVRQEVLGEAVRVTTAGIVNGVVVAVLATRVLRGLLFGVDSQDPLSFAVAIAVLGVAAALASAIPTWRASRTDPVLALRAD